MKSILMPTVPSGKVRPAVRHLSEWPGPRAAFEKHEGKIQGQIIFILHNFTHINSIDDNKGRSE